MIVPPVKVPAGMLYPPVIEIPPGPESVMEPVAVLAVDCTNIPPAPVLVTWPSTETAPYAPAVSAAAYACEDVPMMLIPPAEVIELVAVKLMEFAVALIDVSETGPDNEVMAAVF